MTRWSLFLQTLSLLHHFLGLYSTDPDTNNNTSTVSTNVAAPSHDLAIVKSDSPDPVTVGGFLTYTITVTNNGTSTSTAVVLTDALTSTLVFISATPSQGACSESGGTVTCNLGVLGPNSSTTVTITVATGSLTAGTLTNSATVSGAETEPVTSNNTSTATTTVQAAAPVPGATGWALVALAATFGALLWRIRRRPVGQQ